MDEAAAATRASQQSPSDRVGFTSLVTAAFRAVELQHSDSPIITDPLAQHLGDAAMHIATAEWQELVAHQGPGRSLRVPGRNRVLDDLLLQALSNHTAGAVQCVQVVNIGCGMDSKPWRLQLPCGVHWFDVDQPGVLQLKQQLLHQAGAATTASTPVTHNTNTSTNTNTNIKANASNTNSSTSNSNTSNSNSPAASFPLLVRSWVPVAADLKDTTLRGCLHKAGFDAARPTVWMAEALLYYLPLEQACSLLADMRALSAPGSKLLATCVDRELYEADHQRMQEGHHFHAMWWFCMDDLVAHNQQRLRSAGFVLDMQPCTTAELAMKWYGRQTYVPLYGGAECVFTGDLLL